jgi:hypothetical protein
MKQRVLPEKAKVVQQLKYSRNFMEPDGSLPCSQDPATGTFPEPIESSSHPPFPSCFFKIHSITLPFIPKPNVFLEVKREEREADHSPPSHAKRTNGRAMPILPNTSAGSDV